MPDRVILHRATVKASSVRRRVNGEIVEIKPAREVDVSVEVNLDAIARSLGASAANSKGRKSIGLSGLVKVRVEKD
jgi:hypothetical protein